LREEKNDLNIFEINIRFIDCYSTTKKHSKSDINDVRTWWQEWKIKNFFLRLEFILWLRKILIKNDLSRILCLSHKLKLKLSKIQSHDCCCLLINIIFCIILIYIFHSYIKSLFSSTHMSNSSATRLIIRWLKLDGNQTEIKSFTSSKNMYTGKILIVKRNGNNFSD
jgi:hypothetical protein